jgi:hypothetical protein
MNIADMRASRHYGIPHIEITMYYLRPHLNTMHHVPLKEAYDAREGRGIIKRINTRHKIIS